MVTIVKQRFGKIDVLVNNAGIKRDHTVKNMSVADWHEVIDSDLTGIFNCTRCVLEIMIKQGFGNIVNVASIIGQTGNFGQANYAAAKAGVIGFTRSVAKEVANKGIRVNAVAPGFINTDFIKSIPEQTKNQILFNIPMKRFGEPFEVAKTILFLVSDDSSYLTGSVINVDGGYN
jgi:3-oxoacyl-[acyl-carrier protein] reductase